jgi:tRNA/tmRNA/rRNA uracil-C5-methylase (TrmA/RlmC/RlmD family)
MTRICERIVGVYVYEGDSGGRYYLGTKSIRSSPSIRKLYGKGEIYQKILGRSFLYSPLSFSQINPSIVESMVSRAGQILHLENGITLFDLYCGYGLFSLCLAAGTQKVVGIEASHDAVESAIANAKRHESLNVRFVCRDITSSSIQSLMRNAGPEDVVVLDPPRGGAGEGVIESIATKRPARVLHLFCNIDLMPKEINRWVAAKYKIAAAIPFDMFPGTSTVETMVLFEREK